MSKRIGSDIRQQAFRDTKRFYLEAPAHMFSENLIAFAVRYSGKQILDVGCATGNYMLQLQSRGYQCSGVDVNPRYVAVARKRGLNVYRVQKRFPLKSDSFDSSLLFEVLEHVTDLNPLLREVRRVTRSTVLITVPNCEDVDEMKKQGTVYEHLLDKDHRNFFTRESLEQTLKAFFPDDRILITRGDPVSPASFVANALARLGLRVMRKLKVLKPRYYFRLYAVVFLNKPLKSAA